MRPHSGEELSLRNLASLHLSLPVRADALLAHAPGIGLHSAVLLTLFHSTVPLPACRSSDNAVFCVRQASELHEMPRARGIGMARPKKKKVEKVEEVEEVEEEETPESPPAPEPPAPPSPPRKPMKPVAAESPSKSVPCEGHYGTIWVRTPDELSTGGTAPPTHPVRQSINQS